MRLSFRLILTLTVAITLVTFVVARNQVRSEKQDLRADLGRRAETLAESLQETIEPAIQKGDVSQIRRIVARFGSREHVVGIAVFDNNQASLAMSPKLVPVLKSRPSIVHDSIAQNQELGNYEKVSGLSMYVYAVPLHRDSNVAGTLALFEDASYIDAQSSSIWRDAIWHVIAQVLLIILITVFAIRWTITGPIHRAAAWMKDLRNGKAMPPPDTVKESFLGPLSVEATRLAQKLAEARATAVEEAQLREAGESVWTAERLRANIHKRLRGSTLFVVSNREPFEHVHGSNGIEVRVPASGLVTALEPILCACDGTWIAHGAADADKEVVDKKDHLRVPPEHPLYTLRRVWLTREEVEGYYLGFANEGVWPLCHIAHTRPVFRGSDWELYQRVNEKFAKAVLEEIEDAERPFVLIQDYHFALLPRLIKKSRPDARVAIFWHIPWPNAESFRICPWGRELLDGVLGADLVSFHIQAHCNNFLETVDQSLQTRIEWDRFSVNRNDHLTLVRPHPISVPPPDRGRELEAEPFSEQNRSEILARLGPDVLFFGVGVDRVDYTKGLLERFLSIERFLEKYPHYCEQFAFVQFGAPSRTALKRYQDFFVEVEAEANRINRRFQTDGWKPILLFNQYHSHVEIEPYYKAADFCLVTSLHDGMNLVAKEFVATRNDQDGVLILSRFTGASRELRDALQVNPYDIEQVADAIRRSLEMPSDERHSRMKRMRRVVREHNIYRWAAELILDLSEVRLEARASAASAASASASASADTKLNK